MIGFLFALTIINTIGILLTANGCYDMEQDIRKLKRAIK